MSNICLVGQPKIDLIFRAIQEGHPPPIISPHEVRAALHVAREQKSARIDWSEYLKWMLIVDELERLKEEWKYDDRAI